MNDYERELLQETSKLVVSLCREQYGLNLSAAYDNPFMKKTLHERNDMLLDCMSKVLALKSKVDDLNVPVDTNELIPVFKKEILKSIREELERVSEKIGNIDPEAVVDDILAKLGVDEEDGPEKKS